MISRFKSGAFSRLAILVGIGSAVGTPVAAASIDYTTPGTENPARYSFKATSTGPLNAYFLGSTAAFSETLGLLVNGKDTGINGLNNKASGNGEMLSFGNVKAGDTLTFYITVKDFFVNNTFTYYSDPSLNPGGTQQVYSTAYTGGDFGIPTGLYTAVSFEDLNPTNDPSGSDFNYQDEKFAFDNTSVSMSPVPLPASAPLFGAAILVLGTLGYGIKRRTAPTAA